jgi:hypothetical protein
VDPDTNPNPVNPDMDLDTDPVPNLNMDPVPDSDMDPEFGDQKLKKKKLTFFSFLFWSKIAIHLSLGLQATEEVFSPQKRTSSTSNVEIY